jgi:hypothetical protein
MKKLNLHRAAIASLVLATLLLASNASRAQVSAAPVIGAIVDQLNGIPVYYNGPVGHSSGRNLAPDGYNLGLRYQCVEFIKRYYYQRLGHRMPNATGDALHYFDPKLADGSFNASRGLLQYRNGSPTAPQLEDILVFGARPGNPYGHMAIVSAVNDASLEFIQQNPGPKGHSRQTWPLRRSSGGVTIDHPRILGWLRLPSRKPAPADVLPVTSPPQEITPPSPPPSAVPPRDLTPPEEPAPDSVPPSDLPQQNLPETPAVPSAKSP